MIRIRADFLMGFQTRLSIYRLANEFLLLPSAHVSNSVGSPESSVKGFNTHLPKFFQYASTLAKALERGWIALGDGQTPAVSREHGSRRLQRIGEAAKAVSAGDFDVIEEICTASVVNHTPLADVEGHAALKAYESRIHEAFPGFGVTFDDLVVEGSRVAMRLTITGVHRGPMMDIEPTGREVTFGNMSSIEMKTTSSPSVGSNPISSGSSCS